MFVSMKKYQALKTCYEELEERLDLLEHLQTATAKLALSYLNDIKELKNRIKELERSS